jgi:hypothetical protein
VEVKTVRTETQVELEKLKHELVKKAEKVCADALPQGVVKRGSGITKSNLQNLLTAATSTTCVAEVENFVRYQTGRLDAWQARRTGPGKSFGETVLVALDDIQKLPTGADPKAGLTADPELQIEAVRHFLGYLLRQATYLSAVNAVPRGGDQGARQAGSSYQRNRRP